MGTKKIDKEFLWLKVLHLIEDEKLIGVSNVHKVLKKLNKNFFIKERKKKDLNKSHNA